MTQMQESSTQSERDRISSITRTLQIIVGMMCMGALIYLGVALMLRLTEGGQGMKLKSPENPTITYVSLIFAGAALVFRLVGVSLMAAGQRRQIAQAIPASEGFSRESISLRAMGLLVPRTIVATAVLEGAALVAVTAFLLEGRLWVVPVAGLMIGAMAAGIPTCDRLQNQLESEIRATEDLRRSPR